MAWLQYFTDQEIGFKQDLEIEEVVIESDPTSDYHIPDFIQENDPPPAIKRASMLKTIIPERENTRVLTHLVAVNDSMFGLAEEYGLEPESILWSNYDTLQDSPHSLTPGMELLIPPVDGIYYQWEVGDDFESVAAKFQTEPELITRVRLHAEKSRRRMSTIRIDFR